MATGGHPRTGLVPVQVDGSPGRGWDPLNLSGTEDPREADGLNAGTLLDQMWRDWAGGLPEEAWTTGGNPCCR